ncbi:MAG: DUF2513 domain-containing protein [Ectobacillus sp.]
MKRDIRLIKQLLEKIEEEQQHIKIFQISMLGNFTEEQINHHLHLLNQAGLISLAYQQINGKEECYINRITWTGHEFLRAMENEETWAAIHNQYENKTLEEMLEAVSRKSRPQEKIKI